MAQALSNENPQDPVWSSASFKGLTVRQKRLEKDCKRAYAVSTARGSDDYEGQ